MNIGKTSAVAFLLPLPLCAQVQSKTLPQAARIVRDTVQPGQPGLISFRVSGASLPQGMWATLTLSSKAAEQTAGNGSAQYACQATESLFLCPIVSLYGRPSGTFRVTSIILTANSPSGQSNRTFKAGEDFGAPGDLTIENPPQPPSLDGLKISNVDVDGGDTM